MTPRQKMINALELREPKGLVPIWELPFNISKELCGRDFHNGQEWEKATKKEVDKMIYENAEIYIEIAKRLDYSGLFITHGHEMEVAKTIKRMVGNKYFLAVHGDATYSIPTGSDMTNFIVELFEHPDEMKRQAEKMVTEALERGKQLVQEGIDGFALCSDYCFNAGPFLSPKMFAEFVTPFLSRLISGYRDMGAYVIKHTDGNIIPILDQLLLCKPHAIHSLDTQAKDMDLRKIKELTKGKICLIGGVEHRLLQIGTEEEIISHVKYVLETLMPGGGYIFGLSNDVDGSLDKYLLILQLRKKYGKYL